MATYTHQMQLSTGGALTYSGPPVFTDAQAQRMIAAWRTKFGMAPGASNAAVWARLGEHVFDYLKTTTLNIEREAEVAAINPQF